MGGKTNRFAVLADLDEQNTRTQETGRREHRDLSALRQHEPKHSKMDQQGQTGPMGPAGRRLHIAHRRSPSELTPLMSEYLHPHTFEVV
jgi:hypothetical protein